MTQSDADITTTLLHKVRRSSLGVAAVQGVRSVLRIDKLEAQLSDLETRMYESYDEGWDRSRARWRAARPDAHLTWSKTISGDAFVSKVAEHGGLGPTRRVVEVGPGYGRLPQACIERGESFGAYLGVDLSHDNVAHLRERFTQENISFLEGDIETVDLGEPVDTVISSLTFKHLFPSFERALENIARQLSSGGLVIFDLIEGHRRHFEEDGATYIRAYSREEVESIIASAGLELVAFDEVYHLPDSSGCWWSRASRRDLRLAMSSRVLILGAGFRRPRALRRCCRRRSATDADVTLIDKSDAFVFGYSKLDVMFGRTTPDAVRLPYREIAKPGVRFLQETITAIDPEARRVTTDAGVHEADVLVVALGADYDLDATPGLAEAGNEFYSVAGAERLARAAPELLARPRVIGVCGAPFKCPPAPSEAALLLHDYLSRSRRPRRLRDHVRHPARHARCRRRPRPRARCSTAFAERDIEFVPGRRVSSLDAAASVAVLDDGSGDALRPVPRRAQAPRARRRDRERHDRGRLRSGGPDDARDALPGRLRRRRRRARRRAESRRLRRGRRACRRRVADRERRRREQPGAPTTGAAPATSSSAPAASAASTSTSSRARSRRERSRRRPTRSSPRSSSSARAAARAGSAR